MTDINTTELNESQSDAQRLQIHTALPARVVSFNPLDQTVKVELMIEQVNRKGEQLPLPPLVDVPVKMFSYGSFSITAAPKEGDEGLASFSERCIDGWWESGRKSIPLDIRFHDLSDAFFDGGYKSKPNALMFYPNSLNITGASNYVRLNEDGTIEIKGATTFLDNVTAPDFVTESGISLNDHKHGGVQSGGSDTGSSKL